MSSKPKFDFSTIVEMMGQAQTRTIPGWWNAYTFNETISFQADDLVNFAKSSMFSSALLQGETVHELKFNIFNHNECESFCDFMDETEFRLVYSANLQDYNVEFFVSKTGAIQLEIGAELVRANIVSLSKKEANNLEDKLVKSFDTGTDSE